MQWEAVIAFPRMKVGIVTKDERVAGIRYLPPETLEKEPENALVEAARRAERSTSGAPTARSRSTCAARRRKPRAHRSKW